ncbi:hypothetical protein pb186bvf_004005 [Paramecium bursaria]
MGIFAYLQFKNKYQINSNHMQLRQFLKFQKEKDIPYELRCRLCCQLNYNSQCCNQCDAVYCDDCQKTMIEKNKKCLKCRQELKYKQIKGFQREVIGSILCACEFCAKDIYSEKFAKHKQKCLRRHYEFLQHTRKRLYIIPKELKEHQQRFLCGKCKLLVVNPLKCKHCDQLFCEVCANQLYDENKQCICNEAGIIQTVRIGEFDNQGIAKVQLQCPHPNCKDVEFTYYQAESHFYKCVDKRLHNQKHGVCMKQTYRVVKRKAERYQKDVEELNETLRKCQLKKEKLERKSQKLFYAYKNLDQRWLQGENQKNENEQINENVKDKEKCDDQEIKKVLEATPEETKQDNEPRGDVKQTETDPIVLDD